MQLRDEFLPLMLYIRRLEKDAKLTDGPFRKIRNFGPKLYFVLQLSVILLMADCRVHCEGCILGMERTRSLIRGTDRQV